MADETPVTPTPTPVPTPAPAAPAANTGGQTGSWEPETVSQKLARVGTQVGGTILHRAMEPVTQAETEKIPGLEPDRVAALQESGQDTLGSIFGKEKGDYVREHILHGFTPEVTARAAAKTLTDWYSPAMQALSVPGRVAHGYAAAAKAAEETGDMALAASHAGKARLAALLGFGTSGASDVNNVTNTVENWDKMSPAERAGAVSMIVGRGIVAGAPLAEPGVAKGIAEHVKETAKTFAESAKEEGKAALEAKAPEGSMEAGFAKIGGKKVRSATGKPGVDASLAATGGKIPPPAAKPPETEEAAAPEYHPDLQKVIDLPGVKVHTDPKQVTEAAHFVTPDGKFVRLPEGVDHDAAINTVRPDQMDYDPRISFINDTGAVRIRPTVDRAGQTLHVSVPAEGVTPEQVDALKQSVGQGMKSRGNMILETAATPQDIETTDKEVVSPRHIDDMLRDIKAHPDQKVAPEVSPNPDLQASAQKYAKAQGMPEIKHEPVEANPERATEIAKQYDAAKHDPNNPQVKAAYDALKSETLAQFRHLRDDLGLKFEPQAEDPYKSAGEMMDDVKNNRRLKVYSTADELQKDHPLSEIAPGTGGQTYNTVFRWVHDAMGHAAGGNDFSENGEKSATEAHAQMYSDAARPAMRAETEGQTSWFFHNPKVVAGEAQPGEFAPQKATILPDAWHETAGKKAATDEAGGIDPRTGKSDTKGTGTEILPELRQSLDHAPTPADFANFYNQHKDIFDQHPELRVGWDNKSAVEGGHEINVGAVGPNAAKVARNLDQKSAFDIAKGEIIPTGGTGLKTNFSDYPLEDRLRDLNTKPTTEEKAAQRADAKVAQWRQESFKPSTGGTPDAPAAPAAPAGHETVPTISTRTPSIKANKVDITDYTHKDLTSDMEAAAAAPGFLQKLADRVSHIPGFRDIGGEDADARTKAFIRHAADNTKFVQSKVTPEEFKTDSQWYPVGAHERGIAVAEAHNLSPHQAYAATAALSPLTDWDANTAQAERAAEIWNKQQGTTFTPEMRKAADEILTVPTMEHFRSMFKSLEGKKLGELPTLGEQAWWLRLYEEGHYDRAYKTWNADGTEGGFALSQDGTPKALSWSFQSLIENAIDIMKDGSQENISRVLGEGHKVRNFYNNQLSPNDPRFLTIDTHQVNVAQLRPMSGSYKDVADNFGTPSNAPYGLSGTYPLYDAAVRLAAKELGIEIPSRLQSSTWVKIRKVFTNKFKTPENLATIDAIWKEHEDGKITADQARNKIWDFAEGWNRDAAGKVQGPSDSGELFEPSVRRETAEGTGRGDRGNAAGEVPAEDVGDTSFEFGANVKSAHEVNTAKVAEMMKAKQEAMKKGISGLSKPSKK